MSLTINAADIVILAVIAFLCVLSIRHIWIDHKNGVPSCGYACGGACTGSCRALETGRRADGTKISKREVKMFQESVRRALREKEEGKL